MRNNIKRHYLLTFLLSILFMTAACIDEGQVVRNCSVVTPIPYIPVILTPPASDTINEGSTATLSVVATVPRGSTLTYQWQQATRGSTDFTDIAGATATSYTTPALSLADSGVQYCVVVTATLGKQTSSVTSVAATLSVLPLLVTTITTPPTSDTINEGSTATLSVVATPPAGAALSYQWQTAAKGSTVFTNIAGATSDSYTTPILAVADGGVQYRVVVTATDAFNRTSSTTSDIATISVLTSTIIVWTHIDGSKRRARVPADGILMNTTLTATATDIKSVDTIPSSVTTIGAWAFNSCKALTSIGSLNNVTTIGSYAFSGCKALTSISSLRKLTRIGNDAFSGCIALKNIGTLSSVIAIGSYAFWNCISLAKISMPKCITIETAAFRNCLSLTNITLPNSMTSIGKWAFEDCSSLTHVRVEATKPPSGVNEMFGNTHVTLGINVPSASVDAYKTAAGWSAYAGKIKGY